VGALEELDGNSEHMITGTLAGAIIASIFTALFEGSNDAYQYSLSSSQQGDFTLIQKEKVDIKTGCVKVKMCKKISIVSAPNDNCSV
jgi:predicted acylesterase/phospholipase RssA